MYRGRRFQSRLEADAAQLLTLLGIRWEYESESFLLTCGEHYRPDYFLPGLNTWFETRGYDTPHGRTQLEGFASDITQGVVRGRYATLTRDGLTWTSRDDGCEPGVLLRCRRCGAWGLGPESSLRCPVCGICDNRQGVWDLEISGGRLRVRDAIVAFTPVEFASDRALIPQRIRRPGWPGREPRVAVRASRTEAPPR